MVTEAFPLQFTFSHVDTMFGSRKGVFFMPFLPAPLSPNASYISCISYRMLFLLPPPHECIFYQLLFPQDAFSSSPAPRMHPISSPLPAGCIHELLFRTAYISFQKPPKIPREHPFGCSRGFNLIYLILLYFFQVPRRNSTSMGRISRRPASMSNIRTVFDRMLREE